MSGIPAALGRKILCLSVIFNSIVSVLLSGNILYIFYISGLSWRPYWPYLLNSSLFWFIIVTSILNIVAAKILGNVDLKRIKFHHYFYGFLASAGSFIFMALFAPAYLFILLMPMLISDMYSSAAMPISAAFFLVYGGMTLIIDDIQDVSLRLGRALNNLKNKLKKLGKALETFHLCCSIASIYVALSIILWGFANGLYSWGSIFTGLSAGIFALNLLITSIWGLGVSIEGFWLKSFTCSHKEKNVFHLIEAVNDYENT